MQQLTGEARQAPLLFFTDNTCSHMTVTEVNIKHSDFQKVLS